MKIYETHIYFSLQDRDGPSFVFPLHFLRSITTSSQAALKCTTFFVGDLTGSKYKSPSLFFSLLFGPPG